jgi:hypothetical protein
VSSPRFRGVAVHDAWAPYDTYTVIAASLLAEVANLPGQYTSQARHVAQRRLSETLGVWATTPAP